MKSEQIKSIAKEIENVERQMDWGGMTIAYGLKKFTYGSSSFLDTIYNNISLNENDTFYDLGCGYGLVLWYGAQRFPNTQFKGIEIVRERCEFAEELAKRDNLKNINIFQGDLLQQDISDGNIFYIYNSLYSDLYTELVKKLKAIASQKVITIIAESSSKFFDKESWLIEQCEFELSPISSLKIYKSK
ncbi:class I SAM-dependent methyltransferase [Aureibacter tunicatorum]|uniref:SAM-dependent methyltransferase n=1 Tax=Aureibacter tunicatorum TaxID=866807 RepID=A0AAE3XMV3_9BACT|nr:class I SAM-dependent methyltransferase [Aureibacter tunicatorum]MDR6240831.1 SAM-dependent methyltransferase [Aureibacter tunicatorum]BDD06836.1 hypothetical protein AUTU_43190 [Aureibacter tunicatorum]